MNNFSDTNTITLRSNVESVLDGAEVVCSNITQAEYTLNGETKTGLTANLALPDREDWLRLGEGQQFDFQGKTYQVVEVNDRAMMVQELAQDEEEE